MKVDAQVKGAGVLAALAAVAVLVFSPCDESLG